MTPEANTPAAGGHAVVVGSSLAGLLAARVLSGHFDRVTVLERDRPPETADPRKGVPQAPHGHGLLEGGRQAIESLFPGFTRDLTEAGAFPLDTSADSAWFHYGVWKLRVPTDLTVFCQSRALIDWLLYRRVGGLPDVRFRGGVDVTGLLSTPDAERVTGVRLWAKGAPAAEELAADLVVDATGRRTRFPGYLEALGYPPVPTTEVRVNVRYATRLFRPTHDPDRDWKVIRISAKPPHQHRAGVIFPIEPDDHGPRWLVSMQACGGADAPRDEASFMEHARSLSNPQVYEAIKDAEPVEGGKMWRFAFAANTRRFYERCRRHPEGFVALGDALCCLNPVYTSGISLAAKTALVLSHELKAGPLPGLPRRFFRNAAEAVHFSWHMSLSEDFRYPDTAGARPFGFTAGNWVTTQLLELCGCDEDVWRQFLKVGHLTASPLTLAAPRFLMRAVAWGLGFRGGRRRQAAAYKAGPTPEAVPGSLVVGP